MAAVPPRLTMLTRVAHGAAEDYSALERPYNTPLVGPSGSMARSVAGPRPPFAGGQQRRARPHCHKPTPDHLADLGPHRALRHIPSAAHPLDWTAPSALCHNSS